MKGNNLLKKIGDIPKNKKFIVFDLDGTLVETKSVMDEEMASLFCRLLESKLVAVISGAKYDLFREQIIKRLNCSQEALSKLFLFPTTATSFYCYNKGWKLVYANELSKEEKAMIKIAFKKTFKEINYKKPEKTYGKVIEDRKSQITFSVLGQDVVKILGDRGVELKKEWKAKNTPLKMKIAKTLAKYLPDLEVRAAGYSSIDVTHKGIDKEYGIKQIEKNLKITKKDMFFIGDALYPGGNDNAVLRSGVLCFEVKSVDDTKKCIRHFLSE